MKDIVFAVIDKYYRKDDPLYRILVGHSYAVRNKALAIAMDCGKPTLDLDFIGEAALLHDIGIFLTNAPKIHCRGDRPYICHGYLGSELLQKEGLPKHALVCERHTGAGITREEIINNNLPIPQRDMIPLSDEEKIICIADKFFSKSAADLSREKSLKEIEKGLRKYGESKVLIFNGWLEEFRVRLND